MYGATRGGTATEKSRKKKNKKYEQHEVGEVKDDRAPFFPPSTHAKGKDGVSLVHHPIPRLHDPMKPTLHVFDPSP
jgi:hypothetical protein